MATVTELVDSTISDQLDLSAQTPRLVATPAPIGKPGGPGLYHLKGAKLPNYIENIRNALMRGGMSEGRATATAISRCKLWAAGGGGVHPEVKAAAAAAIAELKATAARAKAAHGHSNEPEATILELFNPFHVPAGSATGGQFGSKSGGPGSSAPMKAQGVQRTVTSGMKARKRNLLTRINGLHMEIRSLETKLIGLEAQRHSLRSSAGGSKATGTTRKAKKVTAKKTKKTSTKATKAGTKAKKATSTATTAAKKAGATAAAVARVTQQIHSVRRQIATKRATARMLTKQAAKL